MSPPFAYFIKQPSHFLCKLSLGLREDVNRKERIESMKIRPSPSLFFVASSSHFLLLPPYVSPLSQSSFSPPQVSFYSSSAPWRDSPSPSPSATFFAAVCAFFLCYENDLSFRCSGLSKPSSKHSRPFLSLSCVSFTSLTLVNCNCRWKDPRFYKYNIDHHFSSGFSHIIIVPSSSSSSKSTAPFLFCPFFLPSLSQGPILRQQGPRRLPCNRFLCRLLFVK